VAEISRHEKKNIASSFKEINANGNNQNSVWQGLCSMLASWGMERRVMDMGLTPGTRVTIVKSAPFSGPLEVLVRGSRLVLGRGMAEKIFVEVKR